MKLHILHSSWTEVLEPMFLAPYLNSKPSFKVLCIHYFLLRHIDSDMLKQQSFLCVLENTRLKFSHWSWWSGKLIQLNVGSHQYHAPSYLWEDWKLWSFNHVKATYSFVKKFNDLTFSLEWTGLQMICVGRFYPLHRYTFLQF